MNEVMRSENTTCGEEKDRCEKATNPLKWTASAMVSDDYKKRFQAELQQTKIRYERLKHFCNQIEAAQAMGEKPPKHDCPLYLLRDQQRAMGEYLHCLEIRAIIEEIQL